MAAIVLAAVNAKWIHPSLALRLLKANLEDPDQCAIAELALRQPLAEKTAAILAESPRILGISVSVWNHGATVELLGELERIWRMTAARSSGPRRPVIVLGGPEVTYLPKAADIFRFADFVIRGEGETAFAELCRSILRDKEAGCPDMNGAAAGRRGALNVPGQVNVPGKTNVPRDTFIDALPVDLAAVKPGYPLYTAEDLRRKLIYVEASRGCPFACAFCQSAAGPTGFTAASEGPPVRGRPAERAGVREFPLEKFLADLGTLLQRRVKNSTGDESGGGKNGGAGPRTIKFLDRSFNINIPRALRILEYCLSKTRPPDRAHPGGLQFHFEMVPAVFPEELRKMLVRFPPESLRLEIGIQSFKPETCARINRASNPEGELEVLGFLRTKTNALVHADLIAGLPGEDLASFGAGFDRLWIGLSGAQGPEAAGTFEIQPGILKCLPGTPLRAMAESGAFRAEYDGSAPYEVRATDSLPKADMDAVKNFARFWELIVNRRPFPELLPAAGKPVFGRFMELSRRLLDHFGRNWGIPRDELRKALETGSFF
ncbi:MAG: cobalamin-dependent protein [Treponema sp.]|nr:cobalamin-dependent protein [Treponema sp.]